MTADDVKIILDMAIEKTGIDHVHVRHRPRLLSDNGPCYLAKDLKTYLNQMEIRHTRGAPFHPMTQGKIERFHRSMKCIVKLDNYYSPGQLENAIAEFIEFYNYKRYHESLKNLTPADVFFGRTEKILTKRELIKKKSLRKRKVYNLNLKRNQFIQQNNPKTVS